MSNFRNQTSKFLTVFIIGLVVMAFTFTGFESMKGTPDTVAKVGSTPIKLREFQQEYTRQLNFYKQMFGGKDLTQAQIQNFKIKDTVIKNIAQKKVAINLAKEIGFGFSAQEIRDEIKKLDYFLTNDQFDLRKYKALLKANSYTPSDFEKTIKDDIIMKKYQQVTSKLPNSKSFRNEIKKLKKNVQTLSLIKIERTKLLKFITISNKEIKTYLKDDKNKNRTLSIFNERKKELDTKEQVKARHILIKTRKGKSSASKKKSFALFKKITVKNFKRMANKHTEDPSGKGVGGSLGWFQKGKMVPEFEKVAFNLKPGTISKPVKTAFGYHIIYVEAHKKEQKASFDKFKNRIAKELLVKTKVKELDIIYNKVKLNFTKNLKQGNVKAITKMIQKYGFDFESKKQINAFDGLNGKISIPDTDFNKIFISSKNFFEQKTSTGLVLIIKNNTIKTKIDEKKIDEEIEQLENVISRKLSQKFITELIEKQKIKVFNNLRI